MMMSCLWKPLIGLLTTFELIRDTPVDFKAHLKHTASLCNIMVKSKEISQDIRKRIVNLHKSGSFLGAISRCHVHLFKQLYASVDTMGMSSHYTAQRCPRDERALVRNVHINPRTKAKDLEKMLAEAGKSVSLSTVKRVLY